MVRRRAPRKNLSTGRQRANGPLRVYPIRLSEDDIRDLKKLAKLRKVAPGTLARQFVVDGTQTGLEAA